MAVEIRFFPDHGLRWVRFSGVLELADLQTVRTDVYSRSGTVTGARSFVDLREVRAVDIDFTNLMATSEAATSNLRSRTERLRISCHAPSDLTFGFARIYHALLSNSPEVEAFMSRDRDEALRWLGLDRMPPRGEG